MQIKRIVAREILDSRGQPTIATRVVLSNGVSAEASVPSGASTGKYEAHELRDGGKRYNGRGVLKAVKNVNTKINRAIVGKQINNLRQLDELLIKLDNTPNKKKLGANAILSVSLAVARIVAKQADQPLYKYLRSAYRLKLPKYILPTPMINIFNGGQHASNKLDWQEFMIVPVRAGKFSEKIRIASEIFVRLGKILQQKKLTTGLGDEGGYSAKINKATPVIKLLLQAIKQSSYQAGKDVALALDIAATTFYNPKKKRYILKGEGRILKPMALTKLYQKWLKKYPIISLEDPLAEEDWLNWQVLTRMLSQQTILVGDDIFVTNQERLSEGIKRSVANAVLIKPNQIGTLTETIDCIKLAQKNKYKVIISHRSGETPDDFIADLAVAVNADYIKAGSVARGERVAKYNRLMEIEGELKR